MLEENDMDIFKNLGAPELLRCLAEEAAELSQAALKLRILRKRTLLLKL